MGSYPKLNQGEGIRMATKKAPVKKTKKIKK